PGRILPMAPRARAGTGQAHIPQRGRCRADVACLARATTQQDGAVTATGLRTSRRTTLMIRKLKSGKYRLYSRKLNPKTGKRRNLGTFASREAAQKHERAVQFFKHG